MLLKVEGLIFIDMQKLEDDGVEFDDYFRELSQRMAEVVNSRDEYMSTNRLKIETVKEEDLLGILEQVIKDGLANMERKEEADSCYED